VIRFGSVEGFLVRAVKPLGRDTPGPLHPHAYIPPPLVHLPISPYSRERESIGLGDFTKVFEIELLGDVGRMESRFGPFRDSVGVSAR
jgi:hypothetical protein